MNIGLIARDEDELIEFFCKYHLNLGIKEIYILDDNSNVEIVNIVAASTVLTAAEKSRVKIFRISFEFFERPDLAARSNIFDRELYRKWENSKQRYWYNFIAKRLLKIGDSILLIDADEFLVASSDQVARLDKLLLDEGYAIHVPNVLYGCNFNIEDSSLPIFFSSLSRTTFPLREILKFAFKNVENMEIDGIHTNTSALLHNSYSWDMAGLENIYIAHFFEKSIHSSFKRRTRGSAFSGANGLIRYNYEDRKSLTILAHEIFDSSFALENIELTSQIYNLSTLDLLQILKDQQLQFDDNKKRMRPVLNLRRYNELYIPNIDMRDDSLVSYHFKHGIFSGNMLTWELIQ